MAWTFILSLLKHFESTSLLRSIFLKRWRGGGGKLQLERKERVFVLLSSVHEKAFPFDSATLCYGKYLLCSQWNIWKWNIFIWNTFNKCYVLLQVRLVKFTAAIISPNEFVDSAIITPWYLWLNKSCICSCWKEVEQMYVYNKFPTIFLHNPESGFLYKA